MPDLSDDLTPRATDDPPVARYPRAGECDMAIGASRTVSGRGRQPVERLRAESDSPATRDSRPVALPSREPTNHTQIQPPRAVCTEKAGSPVLSLLSTNALLYQPDCTASEIDARERPRVARRRQHRTVAQS